MLKIDNSLLEEVGLGGLPDSEKNSFLKHIYETLEMRVGVRLADQMTNQQLDEFEQYFEAKDDAGAFQWLETNFPNYKDIVQQEFDKLKTEITQTAPQILAASQAHAAQAVPAQAQQSAPLPPPTPPPAADDGSQAPAPTPPPPLYPTQQPPAGPTPTY
jgi:cell division septation protein DedD